ncbi:MAG: UDP-N-acetylmuramoyl-tripeptide--D-alanyl-D-alanine ligase [Rhodobacteraceae bacterium]|nr:UDP-N-acetylmuramoyl-tripeptide--D-alanyl-D-alanine ligase [Paracoccaceae bacterium]
MSAPLWTAEEIAAAVAGRATRAFAATGVSIDSRTIRPGELFVALSAARDGHDFVADALARGAAGALVSRLPAGLPADAPLVVAGDVQAALESLGRAARARTGARVVAVTGSAGKTSTKEMLREVLSRQGATHASEASYNNHWGVPLTLARMPPGTAFAVVEIGMNHPGEIAPLSRMTRPHVAVVTTVAAAHLEAFDDIAGIAREKASIFEGLEPGGIAVIPSGLAVTPILRAKAEAHAARILSFGAAAADDYRLEGVTLARDTTVARALRAGQPVLYKVQSAGRHFALNALAVIAVAEALGAAPAVVACDIGQWRPPAGRGQRERIVLDIVEDDMAFELIDDAFNANPASVAAALDVLGAAEVINGIGRRAEGRRIAVLGDMLELGPTEAELHRAIAAHPAMDRIDCVHCVGPRMRWLWEVLPHGRRGEWHATAEELAGRARLIVDAGDVVLVKGSKGSRVSLVVDALRKLGQPGAPAGASGRDVV